MTNKISAVCPQWMHSRFFAIKKQLVFSTNLWYNVADFGGP
jgi:hypothetical protein